MDFTREAVLVAGSLFLVLLVALEVGRRIGLRRLRLDPGGAREGTGTVEGAVFALLGLLIAFTFTGAASRFDTRRGQIVEEANAIGTAWLRLDLLPADSQPALRALFREYVDVRLNVHRLLPDLDASGREQARAGALAEEIWTLGRTAAERTEHQELAALAIASLNEMFDAGTLRATVARVHVPSVILALLLAFALLASLLAGFAMATLKSRPILHPLVFAAIMAMTTYVILDLEHPRAGIIRLDSADRVLIELRDSMK